MTSARRKVCSRHVSWSDLNRSRPSYTMRSLVARISVMTILRAGFQGEGRGTWPQASHRTVRILFLANDGCLRDYDLVGAHCWSLGPAFIQLGPGLSPAKSGPDSNSYWLAAAKLGRLVLSQLSTHIRLFKLEFANSSLQTEVQFGSVHVLWTSP